MTSDPAAATSALLDTQLRQQLGQWGAVPIGAAAPQSAVLVDLGRSLFFDKELSGNRDVACASCHDMTLSAIDGMSLAVGTGGSGVLVVGGCSFTQLTESMVLASADIPSGCDGSPSCGTVWTSIQIARCLSNRRV